MCHTVHIEFSWLNEYTIIKSMKEHVVLRVFTL